MTAMTGTYVQYGAGYSAPAGWLSFDASPTLRIQKLPAIGKLLAKLSGNAAPFPDAIRIGDITRGLPVPANSVAGLYASHVLEHLALADMRVALAHSFAVLRPGGIFRLIVPDLLGRAREYVADADRGDPQAAHAFMNGTSLGQPSRPAGMFGRTRAMLGNSQHLWMWDYEALAGELADAGFVDIRRALPGDSGDPMFDRVEDESRFVAGTITEVAVQCRKP